MATSQPVTPAQAMIQLTAGLLVTAVGAYHLFSDTFDGGWRLLAVAQVLIGALWFAQSVRRYRRATRDLDDH